nr:hypothetical protein [Tanacetum cinerariifolium]
VKDPIFGNNTSSLINKKAWHLYVHRERLSIDRRVLLLMLSTKLQVDEDCEMAKDLVMKIFMEANKPKSRRSKNDAAAKVIKKLLYVINDVRVIVYVVKYPLIDWEIHSEGSRSYWKIIGVGGITKAYRSFEDMLKSFDREDLDALWGLVKEKFSSAVPNVDKEKALWVELKRLFEPDTEDVSIQVKGPTLTSPQVAPHIPFFHADVDITATSPVAETIDSSFPRMRVRKLSVPGNEIRNSLGALDHGSPIDDFYDS